MRVKAVIRSNGERTRDVCTRLLREQIDAEVISVSPFTEAVKTCFRMGIESGADWLLTIDADVLVFPGSVDKLISHARDMPADVFSFHGRIRDKLAMMVRRAGNRMYRVEYLDRVLVEDDIRVETAAIRRLTEFNEVFVDDVIGLHDYEQWYSDIYRKAGVHAIKHSGWSMVGKWRTADPDLQCAYAGWHGLPWGRAEKPPLEPEWRIG